MSTLPVLEFRLILVGFPNLRCSRIKPAYVVDKLLRSEDQLATITE